MGYEGVPVLELSDFEELEFQDLLASLEALNKPHYLLMMNYEGSRYDGYLRGLKQDKLLQSTAFEKIEKTDQLSLIQW